MLCHRIELLCVCARARVCEYGVCVPACVLSFDVVFELCHKYVSH
jgi:hypothetical protein